MRYILIVVGIALISTGCYGRTKDTCFAGVYLKSIYDLDPSDFSYTSDFYLWQCSKNKGESLKNIEVFNSKQLSQLYDSKERDGQDYINYESLRAKFYHQWDLRNYPFDKQKLRIQIEDENDTGKTILLCDKDGFQIDDKLSVPGWQIIKKDVVESVHVYLSDFGYHNTYKGRSAYSCVTYEVYLVRNSWGLFLKIFSGLYIAFFVAFVSFFISTKHVDSRFGLSIGGLFAAVGNKYVVDANIPSSITFSLVDMAHFASFAFILVTLIASAYSLVLTEKGKPEKSVKFDKRCRWIVLALYVLTNLVLIGNAKGW